MGRMVSHRRAGDRVAMTAYYVDDAGVVHCGRIDLCNLRCGRYQSTSRTYVSGGHMLIEHMRRVWIGVPTCVPCLGST